MLIVYKAMLTYGYFEAAPEMIQQAKLGYRTLMRALQNDQLPELSLVGPLA